MDTRKLVSLRIQQLCATHGYNINSLARQAGIPPTTLKNIIYGRSLALLLLNFSAMGLEFRFTIFLMQSNSRLRCQKI